MTTPSTEVLKPCPFCSSKNISAAQSDPMYRWMVYCADCGVEFSDFKKKDMAINAWNRRPTAQASEAAILREAIAEIKDCLQHIEVFSVQTNVDVYARMGLKIIDSALSTTPAEPVQTPDCATTPSAQEAQGAITAPDGFALVPRIMTSQMIEEFHCCDGDGAQNKWDAVLAVASPGQSMKGGE